MADDDLRPTPRPEGARPPEPPRRTRTVWQWIGITLAVVLAVCGLVVVAGFVLFAVAMNQWAANK